MLKKFRKQKLYIQMSILAIVTVIIFVIFLTSFSKNTIKAFRDTNELYTNEIIYQLEQTILSNYNSLSDIIRFISFQSDIQNFLLEPEGPQRFDLYRQMQNNLMNVTDLNPQIIDIVLTDKTENTYGLTANSYQLPAEEPQNKIQLSNLVIDTQLKQNYFIMYASIYSTSTLLSPNSHIGTIHLILDKNVFTQTNSTPYAKAQSKLYLTDASGNFVWSNNAVDTPDLSSLKENEYKITSLNSVGLKVISIIEKEDTIYTILRLLLKYLVLFLFCILVVALSWTYLIQGVVKTLYLLVSFISSIRGGVLKDLNRRIHLTGYYEIEVISDEFNGMLSTIDTLTKQLFSTTSQLYEAEILKKQAELEYLRSQINPHFLYNVLESIKGIAAQEHQPQIVTITKSLATIFKYSVKGQNEVPLKDELKIAMNYVSIQLFRFEDRFYVDYEIDEECLNYLIPKMILQPIIENAIVHGIENYDKKAHLIIHACKVNDHDFELLVYNDGEPIPGHLLAQIQKMLQYSDNLYSEDNKKGIGIYNVHNRIRLSYGANYGLNIKCSDHGTTVVIKLPIHTN